MTTHVVHILNGPNINMTGKRDAAHYGGVDYDEMGRLLQERAGAVGLEAVIRQSNHEGVLIDWLHEITTEGTPVIINAGGLTHTSVALRDALDLVNAPKVEVHMSNIHAREPFRRRSYLSDVVDGSIAGFGVESYALALAWVAAQMSA